MADQGDDDKPLSTISNSSQKKQISKWENEPELKEWLKPLADDASRAFCLICKSSVIARLSCLRAHSKSERHVRLAKCSAEPQDETAVEKEITPENNSVDVNLLVNDQEMDSTKDKQVEVNEVPVKVQDYSVTAAWQAVVVEIHGPFECSPSGHHYAISATDIYTKWIEARPLKDLDVKRVSKFLVDNFTRLGFCKYILLSFPEELSSKLLEEIKSQTMNIIPHDACWEKLLCFFNDSEIVSSKLNVIATKASSNEVLKEHIIAEGADWDRHLVNILFKLRTNPIIYSGKKTPFAMLHGRTYQGVLSKKKQKRKIGRPKKMVILGEKRKQVILGAKRKKVILRDKQNKRDVLPIVEKRVLSHRLQGKSHPYGLRTTLKSQAKSSVVSRMLQKSRLKRSMVANDRNDLTKSEKGNKRVKTDASHCNSEKKVGQTTLSNDEEKMEILPHSPMQENLALSDNQDVEQDDEDDEDIGDPSYEVDCHVEELDDGSVDEMDDENNSSKNVVDTTIRKKRVKLETLTEEQRHEIEGVDPAFCLQCPGAGFTSQEELESHCKFHTEDSSTLCCVFCSKEESTWSLMQLHLTAHIEAPISLTIPLEYFTCRECSKVLSSIDNVEKHLQAFHRRRSVVVCKTCGLQARTHRRYVAHAGAHSDTQYECTHCKFHSKSFCAFAEHQIVHQGTGFLCMNCTKVFPSEYHVKDHQKNHKKMDEVNICEFCGKQFFGISAMRHHLRYFHTETELFACNLCSYVGRTKSNLRGHTDRIHKKPFKCPECEYACLAEKTLLKHIDMFHNAENRQFPCSLCLYRGRDVKTLAEHIRIRHRNTRGFSCPTCETVFKTRTLLRDHMPTHTGARAYACKLCDYTAKYRPTMYRHVISKHPGETLSSATTVAGRERRPKSPSSARLPRSRKSKSLEDVKVETENVVSIDDVYACDVSEHNGELILHATINEDDEVAIEGCGEDHNAVTNIPDTNNMVAIMDANLLAEMAASGQVCVQYIEDVGSIETIEVDNDGIELDSETSKAVKEKFQMLTAGLTFSCL